jgi:hypothetical protein
MRGVIQNIKDGGVVFNLEIGSVFSPFDRAAY